MKDHADKLFLLYAFTGLLLALWFFRNSSTIALMLIAQIGTIIGVLGGISREQQKHPPQANVSDLSVSDPKEDAKPTT